METVKRKFKRGKEMWQAECVPGIFTGPVSVGEVPKVVNEYAIEFTLLDSNGIPVPNEHPPVARTSKPFGDKVKFPDSELELLLNDQLEPD